MITRIAGAVTVIGLFLTGQPLALRDLADAPVVVRSAEVVSDRIDIDFGSNRFEMQVARVWVAWSPIGSSPVDDQSFRLRGQTIAFRERGSASLRIPAVLPVDPGRYVPTIWVHAWDRVAKSYLHSDSVALPVVRVDQSRALRRSLEPITEIGHLEVRGTRWLIVRGRLARDVYGVVDVWTTDDRGRTGATSRGWLRNRRFGAGFGVMLPAGRHSITVRVRSFGGATLDEATLPDAIFVPPSGHLSVAPAGPIVVEAVRAPKVWRTDRLQRVVVSLRNESSRMQDYRAWWHLSKSPDTPWTSAVATGETRAGTLPARSVREVTWSVRAPGVEGRWHLSGFAHRRVGGSFVHSDGVVHESRRRTERRDLRILQAEVHTSSDEIVVTATIRNSTSKTAQVRAWWHDAAPGVEEPWLAGDYRSADRSFTLPAGAERRIVWTEPGAGVGGPRQVSVWLHDCSRACTHVDAKALPPVFLRAGLRRSSPPQEDGRFTSARLVRDPAGVWRLSGRLTGRAPRIVRAALESPSGEVIPLGSTRSSAGRFTLRFRDAPRVGSADLVTVLGEVGRESDRVLIRRLSAASDGKSTYRLFSVEGQVVVDALEVGRARVGDELATRVSITNITETRVRARVFVLLAPRQSARPWTIASTSSAPVEVTLDPLERRWIDLTIVPSHPGKSFVSAWTHTRDRRAWVHAHGLERMRPITARGVAAELSGAYYIDESETATVVAEVVVTGRPDGTTFRIWCLVAEPGVGNPWDRTVARCPEEEIDPARRARHRLEWSVAIEPDHEVWLLAHRVRNGERRHETAIEIHQEPAR